MFILIVLMRKNSLSIHYKVMCFPIKFHCTWSKPSSTAAETQCSIQCSIHTFQNYLTVRSIYIFKSILTLSTVCSCISLLTEAMVITAAASIHAPDVTVLYLKGEKIYLSYIKPARNTSLSAKGFPFFLGIESMNYKPVLQSKDAYFRTAQKMAVQKTIAIHIPKEHRTQCKNLILPLFTEAKGISYERKPTELASEFATMRKGHHWGKSTKLLPDTTKERVSFITWAVGGGSTAGKHIRELLKTAWTCQHLQYQKPFCRGSALFLHKK